MKKIFLTLCSVLTSLAGFSQISLSASDIGAVGDQVITQITSWNGPVPGAGANQNYNFEGLEAAGSADTTYFVNPALTPFASNFTASNLAQGSAGTFTYFTKSASSFVLNGFAFTVPPIPGIPFSSAPFKLTPGIPVLNFPATLGQSSTVQSTSNRFEFDYDTTLGILNVSKIGVTATVLDTSNINGFGTAVFPSQSIPVLRNLRRQRISFRIQVFASISIFPPSWIDLPANLIPGGGLPDVYTRDILFWANGKKAPVATVSLDSLGNVASADIQADLLVTSRSMLSARPAFEFIHYPNPNAGMLSWNSEIKPERIEIYSMNGKKLKTIPVQTIANEVNLIGLENGCYLLRAFDSEGSLGQKKLIVNK